MAYNNPNYNPFEQSEGWNPVQPFAEQTGGITLSDYIAKTYLWMFAGLLLTAAVAFGMAASGLTYRMLLGGGRFALIGVTILEFACVIYMSTRIQKMSVAAARGCFFLYAALTGIVFSMYFLMFDIGILIYAFLATAVFFGGMAAAALIFKMELDTIRPFLFGGLILLIVFGLLSFFFDFGAFNTAICYLGMAVFLGYTAYDTTKIRDNYHYYSADGQMLAKASIFSALQLYLDFINLFLYILRILGNRRN